ncbi:S9 family peptidase [Thalassotalea mangrovi]|uniref:S9 family peptidase n=2 Tax=Thalassotalea mangrovi TaxID=2572245 RepID=A0A4U1B5M1_9GAMM|nr:S9 family peptidase [Thalassotalea mangrovi]
MRCILSFCLVFFGHGAIQAEVLPIEAFASKPDVSNMDLSPNGDHVASIVKVTGKKKGAVVSIVNIATGKANYHLFTDNSKFVITSLEWANDDVVLVEAKFPAVRGGVPVNEWRLIQLNIHSGKSRSIVPRLMFKKFSYVPQIQSKVIDILPDEPDFILMELAGQRSGGEPSVYKMKLVTEGSGRTKVMQRAREDVYDWLTDRQNNIRIGIRRDDTSYEILEQSAERDGMRTLWSFEAFSKEEVWPMGFDVEPNILYVKALHDGRDAIFKVDLNDKALTKELVYSNDNYDVTGGLRRDIGSGRVIGVGDHYWDNDYANLKKSLDAALPDTSNYLIDFSADGNRYLVLSTSDNEPGIYLLGDRKAKSLNAIAYRYNQLTPDVLSIREDISYQARDGLNIEGYLTLPKGGEGKKLPTIIFPHGGPISHESSGFDYWSQFLANRGYAVLQMDFRGSSGYGFDFMQMGIASWGQAMQDDVEDGARWMIDNGIADPERICILGASYGGYAALMGTIKSPELYQCAISFAGVMDVEALVKSHRRFINYEIAKKQIGDDFDLLWEISPLKHVKKVNVPVLLMHGEKDRSVRYSQSEDMFDELEDEGKQVEFITLEDGDHYLSNAQNRLIVFQAIERFLAQHL